MSRWRAGFTPIELLVVMVIVTMLAATLLSGFGGVVRHARAASCAALQRQIALATVVQHDAGVVFAFASPTEPVEELELSAAAWLCPAEPDETRRSSFEFWVRTAMIKAKLRWPHLTERGLSDAACRDRFERRGVVVSDIRDAARGHRAGAWPDGSTRIWCE